MTSARSSARAVPRRAGETDPEHLRRLASERRAARERFLLGVRDVVERLGSAYSVEVAEALRVAGLPRVVSALVILERRGFLRSEKKAGPFQGARPGSGHGRRYYRLAEKTNAPR